jgi:hypothetical protein
MQFGAYVPQAWRLDLIDIPVEQLIVYFPDATWVTACASSANRLRPSFGSR